MLKNYSVFNNYYYYMEILKQSFFQYENPKNYVPIGCLLLNNITGQYLIKWNGPAIDHSELLVLQEGFNFGWDGADLTIFITCEPCSMCLTAISLMKISTIVFGCYNPVFGALGGNHNLLNINKNLYKPQVLGGLMEEFWSEVLQEFFKKLR